MANMSYCRFENTAADLVDCLRALENGTELSSYEYSALEKMIETCQEILTVVEQEGLESFREEDYE